jgi:tetratricopeptide (TPR) repeat protein
VITESPKRLIEQTDGVAELLGQALASYERGLDPQRALSRKLTRSERRPALGRWLLAPAALVASVGLLLLKPWANREPEAALLVTAEAPALSATQQAGSADRTLEAQPARSKSLANSGRPSVAPSTPRAAEQPKPAEPQPSSAPMQPQSTGAAAPAPSAAQNDEECLAYARAGDPRHAAACFTTRASGSGLSAQVALYELSRLQRDALGEPAAALASLTQYLERFPNGSLNGEARFSRLELLARLGRANEALTASSQFLSSPFGAERAPEVHLFRGNLLLSAGSASRAVSEYRAALGARGRIGDDAAYQLGLALESAGAKLEAKQAYERYLAQAGGRHRNLAAARLAELSK